MQSYCLPLQSTDTFFNLPQILCTCNEYFVDVGASNYLQFIQIRNSINDKRTSEDKRKPSNLFSLFLCSCFAIL